MEGSWFRNTGKDHSLNKNICTALFYRGEIHFFCVKPLRYLCLSVILNEADFCKNNNNLRLCLYLTSVKYIQCSVNHSTLVTNLITHLKLLCSELFTIFADCWAPCFCKVFFFLSLDPSVNWTLFHCMREIRTRSLIGRLTTWVRLLKYKFIQGLHTEQKDIHWLTDWRKVVRT